MVMSLFSLLKQHGEQSGMAKRGFILLAYMCFDCKQSSWECLT